MLPKDQIGKQINLRDTPKRIISLVPSQTELLFDLGLEEEVVGITKFCIHPDSWFRTKTRVGGTKKIDFDKIEKLNPDLIIANKEENEKEQIEALQKKYKVWTSDIKTLDDSHAMITSIGELTGRNIEAKKINAEIALRFSFFNDVPKKKTSVAYFIWKGPWMVAGKDTFIDHLLDRCGFTNVFSNEESRYPEVTLPQLATRNPQLVLLSSEPFPFKEKHVNELQELLPDAKIITVDGELFSWYGSRLMHSTGYFLELLKKV